MNTQYHKELISALLALGLLCSGPASARSGTTSDIGDLLQIALPAAALGASYLNDDEEGRMQYLHAGGTTLLITHGLKHSLAKARPGSDSQTSFPSGHTAAAFSGAAFLYSRYGSEWGLPAYALAAYTGYSRVWADAHYLDDVIGGASIAILSNLYWTTPINSPLQLQPIAYNGGGLGVQFEYRPDQRSTFDFAEKQSQYRQRFSYRFGPANLNNSSYDPNDNGRTWSTSAQIRLDQQLEDNWQLYTEFAPYEIRDSKTKIGKKRPDGKTRNLDRLRYYELSLGGGYRWQSDSGLFAGLGAGLIGYNSKQQHKEGQSERDSGYLPVADLSLGYRFSPRTELAGHLSLGLGSERYRKYRLQLTHALDERWDIGCGYQYLDREIDLSRSHQPLQIEQYSIEVGYHF